MNCPTHSKCSGDGSYLGDDKGLCNSSCFANYMLGAVPGLVITTERDSPCSHEAGRSMCSYHKNEGQMLM